MFKFKIINVDFYTIALPEDAKVTFDQILDKLSSSPDDDTRIADRDGTPVRLQSAKLSGEEWEGEMIRIRMRDLPVKASLDGITEPIALAANEGLGQETAFLYHVPTRTLAVQRNSNGVSASSFARYFSEKGGTIEVAVDPLIHEDALKKLAKMSLIRRFEVRVASADSGKVLKDQNMGVNAILNVREAFKAPSVAITVSMNRKPGSLASVYQTAKQLYAGNADAVAEKIIISGEDEDGEGAVLNLLKWRIIEPVKVPSDVDTRRLSAAVRRQVVFQAWQKRKAEILKIVTPKTS